MLCTSEAVALGIEERTLYWMRDEQLVEPLSRGVYHLVSLPLPSRPDVAAVMRRVSRAVLCLVSALEFHEIGTQVPAAVQIALPTGVKAPRITYPRTEKVSMCAPCFEAGVEVHDLDGTSIKVFGIAKTIADCFKFRNRIGQNVAVEALRETIHARRATPAEIMRFAKIDHVQEIVRPYVEALT